MNDAIALPGRRGRDLGQRRTETPKRIENNRDVTRQAEAPPSRSPADLAPGVSALPGRPSDVP